MSTFKSSPGGENSPIVTHVHPDEGETWNSFSNRCLTWSNRSYPSQPNERLWRSLAPWGVGDLDKEGIGLGLFWVPNE